MTFENTDAFASLNHNLILEAAESTGVRCTGRVMQLNSMENRVYSLEVEDSHRQSVVIKFYRPGRWTQQQIQSEHAMALVLQAEGISTPSYLPIEDSAFSYSNAHYSRSLFTDDLLERIEFPDSALKTLGKAENFPFCVWEKVSGRSPLEIVPKELIQVGSMIARMHNLFDSGLAKEKFQRHSLSTEYFLLNSFSYLEEWGKIPGVIESRIFDIGEQLVNGLSWINECCEFVPVHGDLHRLNLIQTSEGGEFWMVDFDDCFLGPEIQDLWLLASTCDISLLQDTEQKKSSFDFLKEGYEHFRKLPLDSELLIEPLRTFRMVLYMGWIARRWKDDAFFRSTFSFFETESYWEKSLCDLEDQFQLIKEKGLLDTAK